MIWVSRMLHSFSLLCKYLGEKYKTSSYLDSTQYSRHRKLNKISGNDKKFQNIELKTMSKIFSENYSGISINRRNEELSDCCMVY